MHIIKITPKSFKIILSKDDLKRYGVENILDSPDLSSELLSEIIDKTNRLYGCPFDEGAIDAEFFESKDGGGELFLCGHTPKSDVSAYLFTTDSCDILRLLCKRLSTVGFPQQSRLYSDGKKYYLILFYGKIRDIILSVIREYGQLLHIGKLEVWTIEEHTKVICPDNAASILAESL